MGSGFYKDYKNAIEQVRKDTEAVAVARARYRVQDDFNRELIEEIADKTGHPNLAASCFVDVDLSSNDDLDVHIYNDHNVLEGLYTSNSSFHKSGEKWMSITKHYNMSKDEFWEKKQFEDYGGGSYGVVDTEWLADNFWDGTYWATNGWPRGDADILDSYPYKDVSAISVIKSYYGRYIRSNRFQQYIQEEINSMI